MFRLLVPKLQFGNASFLETPFPPPHNHHSCCDIVTEAFVYSRKHKELKLYGWVIMPNHLHAVVQATELSRVMADSKKFTARRLIEQLKIERRGWLLEILRESRSPT